ncbi:MAG TPA: flagellar basal-body MS-ring/collar protein FliF [Nitrospirota bacterium]|nr:flagellar basal-body MS-ring/collar protein FliF [Nitrospirota bacterium]
MAELLEQVRTMPPKKMITLLVVLGLVITAGILLATWVQKADNQLLYSNLSEEDAGAIAQKLTEMRVPYTTTAGGIMVPADKVYELRLQLAGQGLPQGGGVGFELFDKTSFTMTDFVQKLNYRRALQGELSRTIRSLAEIDQSRVHLVVPEKSLFMQKEDRPKASVLIKLKAGKRLSAGQVQGIVHLVSSSVEGLDARDVSVVNSTGEMLTSVVDENFAASGGQLEYQRSFEKEIETRVTGMLEPVVGKGKIKARAAASFDFTKVEKTEEKYDPESQVARSEQRNTEKSTSGTSGGIPGTTSNLPGKQQAAQASPTTQGMSEKKSETINYEVSKTISRVVSPANELKRLSVVVLVDGTYAAQQGSTDKKYTPRSEEEVRQFEDMVKKAVGYSQDRGDEVKVVNMPFEVAPQEEIAETGGGVQSAMPMIMTGAKFAIPLVGLVLLFVMVIKPLMKTLTSMPAQRPVLAPQIAAEQQKAIGAPERSSQEQLVAWAKANPKEATNLIKGWLEEK